MRKILIAAARVTAILMGLTVLFCGLLFLSGLGGNGIQSRVQQHLKESIPQFEKEGSQPNLLQLKNKFYTLDNFTETTILQEALFMNTAVNPASIFENPRVSMKNTHDGTDVKIVSFAAAVNGAQSNSNYSYYWMGFRAIVRPLLIFMNYPNIRLLLSIGFYLLLAAACFTIYRNTNIAVATAFLLSVLGINIAIASIELQFACCFYLMFLAIILLPYIRKIRVSYPEFFLIIGAATQYFDFYTTPVITLAAPLMFLLASKNLMNGQESSWKILIKCISFWLLGYGATWLIRLLLTSIALRENGFEAAFGKLKVWTGIEADSRYSQYTVLGALKRNIWGLITRPNVILYFVTAIAIGAQFIKKLFRRTLQRPKAIYLLIALLPVLWLAVSYKAASAHYWFQYRSLCTLTFGGLMFALSAIDQTEGAERHGSKMQQDEKGIASTTPTDQSR